MWQAPDALRAPLYVVSTIFNPIRYRSRWELYQQFATMVKNAGAQLYTVEAAFGDRAHGFQVEDTGSRWVRVRTSNELWIKENLLNIGISRLPANWEYVAWIDGDVAFTRPDWMDATRHALQHYSFVQLFSHAIDLSPTHTPLATHQGFAWCYAQGMPQPKTASQRYYYPYGGGKSAGYLWHPGYAWAARRDALDAVGGLIDFAILGAGDHHMAKAMIGQARASVHPKVHPHYLARVLRWEARVDRHTRNNVGCVPGTLLHYWHGKKRDRHYWDRWKILVDNQYDPAEDIKKDVQGIWQLSTRKPRLRDHIRGYFRARNEDSIDVDTAEQPNP